MAADSPKRSSKYHQNVVRPQPFSDKTVMESVVDFISDVVPQAYSGHQKQFEDKEKIQWVRFESSDINDICNNPDLTVGENKGIPLLLILGYSNGVQIWNVLPSGEALEVLSLRQGPVKIARVLPTPVPVKGDADLFHTHRPLMALCDTSSAGQPYCSVKIVSLKTGDEVHSLNFPSIPVLNIECNKRVLVIIFQEKICIFDACTFKQRFWVTSCFPCPGPDHNPIALGIRWLAYADKRLVPMHQSCGGMSGDGAQSYAATVISAAKGAFKGLTMFGEAMVNSVTGCKPQQVKKIEQSCQDVNGFHPGIVSIIDLQTISSEHFCVGEESEGDGLIAHFHAHANEPVAKMAFDSSGTLLLTACKLGHNFHVFRVMAHPCSSSLGAVHHLYTLHRGETTAKVVDISFSQDSRWITLCTHRGTTHVFPITPYGGAVSKRTHCSSRVVNRASRFHKSAGLDEIQQAGGRSSPVLSASPSSSSGHFESYPSLMRQNVMSNNTGNPRLPPYPHPTTLYALAQIKQPLLLTNTMAGMKNQSPSHSPLGTDNVLSVCSHFSTPRLWVGGSSSVTTDRREGKRAADSLFVMCQTGTLVEYVLEPRPKALVDKGSEETPLELLATGYIQWNLQRPKTSEDIRLPLATNNPLIQATEAVTTQQPTTLPDVYTGDLDPVTRADSKDSLSSDHGTKDMELQEQWLSQVEIITHVGPHRRLWMGPQFSFKTYQNVHNTTVLSSNSSALLSQSPEANVSAMDIVSNEVDLESLKIHPARSSPVAMPTARPAYRRLSGSDSTPPPGKGSYSTALLIEAGSFEQSPNLCDVYSSWAESTVAKQPRGSEEEEDRIKETLAEAMLESPVKGGGPSSISNDVFVGSNDNLSTSSGSSTGMPLPRSAEHVLDNVFPSTNGSLDSSS
ncbi:breast carcinoma-amplified sequence 3-like [Pecten maximus]|uniref:breast carcinoma-amplified sequence 3-like n=1 Tax=Pecten maximus TaxID=6579 RepID=UPI001458C087|nr:breast carcinoma-amplified sequence 3-like [Pecten maximus]